MKVKKSSGLLSVDDITSGAKALIYSEPVTREYLNKFGELSTSLNAKVRLQNGVEKLASIFGFSIDACIDKWGDETADWVGHTLKCTIVEGKKGPYIMVEPSDEPRDMSVIDELSPEMKAQIEAARAAETASREAGSGEPESTPF